MNDEFAKDLGDFQNLEELRAEIRKTIFHERELSAQNEAKNAIIEKLVERTRSRCPDAFVDQQVQGMVEGQLRSLSSQGVDVSKLKLDWNELRKAQAERATRDVRASLLLEKVAVAESIFTSQEEVDAELSGSRANSASRLRLCVCDLKKTARWADRFRIRTEKTLGFLFEQALKTAPVPVEPSAEPTAEPATEPPAE